MRTDGSLAPLLLLCAVGVGLRGVLLALVGSDPEIVHDEAHYLYLALSWNHFGFYSDSYRYLWPPGYPLLLGSLWQAFEVDGLLWLRVLQVLLSASVGLSTMLLARRLGGQWASVIAGGIWCLYLPLAAFTHTLWSETLFLALLLPSLLLLVRALEPDGRDRDLLGAGLLFGLALYVKEAPFYLAFGLAGLVCTAAGRGARREGVRRGLLFLLVIAALLTPWSLRNAEVYGRFVPVASSLGENVFRGLNAGYTNFDFEPFRRAFFWTDHPMSFQRQGLAHLNEPSWERAAEIRNTPDRLDEQVRRGLAWSLERPGWLLRSRVKKAADLLVPMSFFVRHAALRAHRGRLLDETPVRRALVVWAVACPVALLILGVPGIAAALRRPPSPAAGVLLATLAYFAATGLLVAMSRFRIPMVPPLIALAAGFLARPGGLGRGRWLAVGGGWLLLGLLWWIDLPELSVALGIAWRGGP